MRSISNLEVWAIMEAYDRLSCEGESGDFLKDFVPQIARRAKEILNSLDDRTGRVNWILEEDESMATMEAPALRGISQSQIPQWHVNPAYLPAFTTTFADVPDAFLSALREQIHITDDIGGDEGDNGEREEDE